MAELLEPVVRFRLEQEKVHGGGDWPGKPVRPFCRSFFCPSSGLKLDYLERRPDVVDGRS